MVFLPVFLVAVGVERLHGARRRNPDSKPRVMWGLTPVINIKYWSEALRGQGYVSETVVRGFFSINERSDFDVSDTDFLWSTGPQFLNAIKDYVLFVWALPRYDVFVFFFDGGFLALSPLQQFECRLLKLAGKKVVLTAYGSDIAVLGELGTLEEAVVRDYPWTVERSAAVRRRVDQMSRVADLVVRNMQIGYLPRYDVMWPSQLAVDTDSWHHEGAALRDTSDTVTIVHAANHREMKGTRHVITAVEGLRAEGLPVRLVLLEGVPNAEVRKAVLAGDVVVEQLIRGYALFAIEAMSAGKPVLSNLRWMPPELGNHPVIQDCPIVDCDASDLQSKLRELILDPVRLTELGRASRGYALKFHAYEAVGAAWAELLQSVWNETPLRPGPESPWRLAS